MATLSVLRKNDADNAGLARARATVYDSVGVLPLAGNVQGDQAFIPGDSSTDLMYIWDGGGWYKMALIQTVPSFTTGPDASYDLAIDGSTTVITLVATDAEGIPVTFSATANSDFNGLATVSQDSSVFTITPKSEDSATTESGTLTFKATDGISIASALSTFNLSFKIVNSNFTEFLLKASGNNGTNTSINDASSGNNTITVTGNAVAQAFTPYHPGGYSAYFDGTNDGVRTADHTSLSLGTSDFTVEAWIKPNDVGGTYRAIISDNIYGANSGSWCIYQLNTKLYIASNSGSGGNAISTLGGSGNTVIRAGEWQHIAFTRSSNTARLFHNGVQVGSDTTLSTNFTDDQIVIGANNHQGAYPNYEYVGYISDVRVVKGTAVYTANFTPPTRKLTAIANTSLLTCHLPHFGDASSNNIVVTPAGNTTLRRHGPYDYSAYTPSTHGASVYFDGNDDLRTTGYAGPIGTGDYTVECWAYITARNTSGAWLFQIQNGHAPSNPNGIQVYYRNSSNSYNWAHLTNGSQYNTSTASQLNAWQHVALTRASGTTRLFVNGVVIDTQTSDTYDASSYDDITIAKGYSNRALTGYISDFRIINGTALYTSAFTPPTAPLSAVTNTKYLTCNDTPNIYNASGIPNVITLGGDAKSSTSVTKYANASILLDGSGDFLTIADGTNLDFGSEPFTMEGWYKADTTSGDHYIISSSGGTYNAGPSHFGVNIYQGNWRVGGFNDKLIGGVGSGVNTGIDTNWHHFAWTHNHRVIQFFVDGAQVGNTVAVGSDTFDCGGSFIIGGYHSNTGYGNWDGNLEDIRITKGLSRYPFVRAKETLTAISGTSFLTAHAASITDGSSNSISINSQGDPTVSNFGPAPGMKSVYFDGNDYLQMADGDYKTFGSNDFTIEAWVYPTSVGSGFGNYIWGDTASSGATNTSSTAVLYNSSGKFGAYITVAGPTILDMSSSSLTTPVNNWYHVALVRNGNTFSLFVDGVLSNSATNSNAVLDSSQILTVGRTGAYSGLNFVGYVSNYRIVKGTALYTNSFTPSTAELKA